MLLDAMPLESMRFGVSVFPAFPAFRGFSVSGVSAFRGFSVSAFRVSGVLGVNAQESRNEAEATRVSGPCGSLG
jgi:hypothetical protein